MARYDVPVVMLMFNRPHNARQVLAAIRGITPTQLHLVCDGPREHAAGDIDLVTECRSLVDEIDWDCELTVDFSDSNLGCGRRVSSGLDGAFERFDRAVILEDDCVPHPDFFVYCQSMLDRFDGDDRVCMIAGTRFTGRSARRRRALYSAHHSVWGWATWRSSWASYDYRMSDWDPAIDLSSHYRSRSISRYMKKQFAATARGEIDTWDYRWAYANAKRNRLSLVPPVNLISNIGATGTHDMHPEMLEMAVECLPDETDPPDVITPDRIYDTESFRRYMQAHIAVRAWRKLKRVVSGTGFKR